MQHWMSFNFEIIQESVFDPSKDFSVSQTFWGPEAPDSKISLNFKSFINFKKKKRMAYVILFLGFILLLSYKDTHGFL